MAQVRYTSGAGVAAVTTSRPGAQSSPTQGAWANADRAVAATQPRTSSTQDGLAGAVEYVGAAALSGAGSLSATGTRSRLAVIAATGSGTLTAAAVRTRSGVAAPTGAGSLSPAGVRTVVGAASLTGSGSLAATSAATPAVAPPTISLPNGLAYIPDHVPNDWRKDEEEALLVGVLLGTAL